MKLCFIQCTVHCNFQCYCHRYCYWPTVAGGQIITGGMRRGVKIWLYNISMVPYGSHHYKLRSCEICVNNLCTITIISHFFSHFYWLSYQSNCQVLKLPQLSTDQTCQVAIDQLFPKKYQISVSGWKVGGPDKHTQKVNPYSEFLEFWSGESPPSIERWKAEQIAIPQSTYVKKASILDFGSDPPIWIGLKSSATDLNLVLFWKRYIRDIHSYMPDLKTDNESDFFGYL